jgi:acyl carrier protein
MNCQNTEVTAIPKLDATEQNTSPSPTATEIEEWLISQLSTYLQINPDEIDISEPFAHYQLDSSVAVSLTNKLAAWVNRELPATFFWQYPTIEAVVEYLASED